MDAAWTGRVVATGWGDVRVMSDVWESCQWVEVAQDDGAVSRHWNGMGDAQVDAPLALIEAAQAWRAAKAAAAEAARQAAWQAAEEARCKALICNEIVKGTRVVVARGRKVPRGTVGVVSWLGEGDFGLRAGVKDDAGTVHWTAASNLDRADLAELTAEAALCGGWAALARAQHEVAAARLDAQAAAQAAVAAVFPALHSTVRCEDGRRGTVFWKSADGQRVGVRWGRGREDVTWATADTVRAA